MFKKSSKTLATGLSIRPGENCQLLIGSNEVGDSFKKPRQGQLAGHVMENTYFHNRQVLVVSRWRLSESIVISTAVLSQI